MQAKNIHLLRCVSLVAGAAISLCGVQAFGASAAAPSDAFPNFESYIKISGQAASISGNEAAFQSRTQQPKTGGGGIEDLHVVKELPNKTSLVLDGRALAGAEDYLGRLNLTKNEVGSVDVGYKRFRTFYDGVGGFFPRNAAWFPLNQQDLHTDRGELWAEAKINLPNQPVFTLRYSNATRDGKKDSTIWGDTDFTGIPNNTPPLSTVRKIIPSYIKLGERHEELVGTMKQTVGITTYQLTLLGDRVHNLDTRYVTRFPGEARPFPLPANLPILLVPPLQPAATLGNQIVQWQTDGMDTTMTSITGTTSTILTPKITFRTGLSYQLLNSDFSGDRPIFTVTPTAVGPVVAPTNNFLNLAGGSRVKIYAGSIAFDYKLSKDLSTKLALRGEDKYTKGAGSLTSVAAAVNTTTGAVTITPTNQIEYSRIKETALTPVLDVRYIGIADVTLYASGSKRILNGDERYSTPFNPLTAATGTLALNDISEDHAKYTVGANWRMSSLLTFRSEVFYKDHENKFVGYSSRLGDNFVLGSQFAGLKLTAIAKPAPEVTFTTRYVYQKGKMQVTGVIPGAEEYDSMDAKNHMIGETVDWNPTSQFYMQASANVVFDVIGTVYPRAGITPASATATVINIAYDSNKVLQNSNNNYYTGSLMAGVALTKEDDLQVQCTYYRASNSDAAAVTLSQPYGAAVKEYSASVGLKHKFSDRWIGHAKVGYFDHRNDTTGGNTNFKGPLGYLSVEYGL